MNIEKNHRGRADSCNMCDSATIPAGDEEQIISMFLDRNEMAISKTDSKYGNLCRAVSKNILGNDSDADECVNDAYMKLWNNIPPAIPQNLKLYLCRIVRNISFDRARKNSAKKRGGEIDFVLDELAECISGTNAVDIETDKKMLERDINGFLSSVGTRKSSIFLSRYFYAQPVSQIAKRFEMSENSISVTLNRLRKKLKRYLIERGYEI